jgi:hypothetical protein
MALLTALTFEAVQASCRGRFMTHTSVAAAPFAERGFRVGHVLSRAASVLSRRFLTLFIVSVVALSPLVLLNSTPRTGATDDLAQAFIMLGLGFVLLMVLSALGSGVILHAALQDMRNGPVNLVESFNVGLRRFLPLMLLSPVAAAPLVVGFMILSIPSPETSGLLILFLIFFTRWFVALPACVVERLGLGTSLLRSRDLTKGHRWKIFGLVLLLLLLSLVSPLLTLALPAVGGETLAIVGSLIWTAIEGAISSVIIAVTYHDLRAAKEGIDLEQIAAVFN